MFLKNLKVCLTKIKLFDKSDIVFVEIVFGEKTRCNGTTTVKITDRSQL